MGRQAMSSMSDAIIEDACASIGLPMERGETFAEWFERVGMALGQCFDEIRRCLTAEEGSAYWRRAAKAAARSRANSSNRKRRRHGRAQRTRARR